ncbi:hypothetical protein A0130_02685 [Leifsonia xyli]|nr:hypothetical protein A0130_02685 [Leifsonia xyli]
MPDRQQLLSELDRIAGASSFGALVDSTLNLLDTTLEADLVSYNEMDFDRGTASVVLRPYLERQALAVDAVARYLAEHPVFQWYDQHPGWAPARMSDTIGFDELRASRLYREDLDPIGARFSTFIPLSPFTGSGTWVYLAVNRASSDFTDSELRFAVDVQPALVSVFRAFNRIASSAVAVTRGNCRCFWRWRMEIPRRRSAADSASASGPSTSTWRTSI